MKETSLHDYKTILQKDLSRMQVNELTTYAEEARTLKDEVDVLRHTSEQVVWKG